MRFVSQFVNDAPTVNSGGPVIRPTQTVFEGLVAQPRYNEYTAATYGNFVRNSTSASRWVMRNRDKIKYTVARPTMRMNPWVIAAELAAGVAVGFYIRSKPAEYNFEGYKLMRDCGVGMTYATTQASAICTGIENIVFNSAVNNNFTNPRPSNVFTWKYSRPYPVVPDRHYAFSDKWYQKVVSAGPKVYTPASSQTAGWMPDPWTGAEPYAPLQFVPSEYVIPLPWGYHKDDPYLRGDPDGQPSTQTQVQPSQPPRPGPPGKYVKERKMRIVVPWFNGRYSVRTAALLTEEGLQALDCLWKALPKSARTKPSHRLGEMPGAQAFNPDALVTTPQEKVLDVYRGWSKIDWSGKRNSDGSLVDARKPGALTCLALNHFLDEVVGKIAGGAQDEATRRQVILGLLG